jgi:glycosyltransferase involved in cell wall biosynthesis
MYKIRILMVIGQYFPIIGGAEKQCMLQAEALRKRGYEVNVLTGRWSKEWLPKEEINSVEIVRVGYFPSIKILRTAFFYFSLFFYLIVNHSKFDIVHVHQALRPAVITLLANIFLKKKCIVKIANSSFRNDILTIKQSRNIIERILKTYKLFKKANLLVAVNHGIVNELYKEHFCPHKIAYIPNGTNISDLKVKKDYDLKENRFTIITVGRVTSHKGQEVLLEAIGETENIYVELFGRIDDGIKWQKTLKDIGLSERVKIRGLVKNAFELLPNYDAFVLPSYSEGMCNALLEAMASGLPSIVTNIPGNVELIGEGVVESIPWGAFLIKECGILVNAGDSIGLKKAILQLRKEVSLRKALGESAREKIKTHFDISIIIKKYCEIYERMIVS